METYHDKPMPQGQVINFRDRPHELPEKADLEIQQGKGSIAHIQSILRYTWGVRYVNYFNIYSFCLEVPFKHHAINDAIYPQ